MAKVQNPVIGRSKGSAGGMTFSKGYGKNVMRAKVFEPNNPQTAAQMNQRRYFKTVSEQVATFTPAQLRLFSPTCPKGMGRRNALTRQFTEYYTDVNGQKTMELGSTDDSWQCSYHGLRYDYLRHCNRQNQCRVGCRS